MIRLVLLASNVSWTPGNGQSEYWSYQEIVMHAVSPASTVLEMTECSNPKTAPPCIYCHLDGDDVTEVRFCPPDEGHLDEMFYSFNKGAELNPDPPGEEEQEAEAGEGTISNKSPSYSIRGPFLLQCPRVWCWKWS